MARRIEVQLLDDVDGGPADESVTFSLDGVNYEIDLSAKNATKLRKVLARYIEAGTKLGRGSLPPARRRGRRTASTPAPPDPAQNQAIREWARRKGIEVSDRGRIRREIIEQYEAEAGR